MEGKEQKPSAVSNARTIRSKRNATEISQESTSSLQHAIRKEKGQLEIESPKKKVLLNPESDEEVAATLANMMLSGRAAWGIGATPKEEVQFPSVSEEETKTKAAASHPDKEEKEDLPSVIIVETVFNESDDSEND